MSPEAGSSWGLVLWDDELLAATQPRWGWQRAGNVQPPPSPSPQSQGSSQQNAGFTPSPHAGLKPFKKKKKRRNQSVRKRIYGAGQDAVDDETSLVPTGNVMLREEPAASGEIKYPGGVMVRGWGEWVGWAAGRAAPPHPAPPHPAPTPAVLTRPFAPAAPASAF